MLLAGGAAAVVLGLRSGVPRLDAALDRAADGGGHVSARDVGPVHSTSERLGALAYRTVPVPLSPGQRRALQLQDKSIAEFYADKVVMAVVGALTPALLGTLIGLSLGHLTPTPVLLALVGAVGGFFAPDLLLARSGAATRSGAVAALLVFMDLVTLERLANASATQALHNAAGLSEVALFVQIRTALERARLEQQSPYAELRRLAEAMNLPELADVADVMQLDETGAALSGTLRARVRELRDAHLSAEQMRASADAEGMTIYMTLPALAFGLILLTAALLQIAVG